MGIFDDSLEPGHKALKPCPECGEDEIGARSKPGFTSKGDYYCDECGYEPTKAEVNKSLWETLSAGYDKGEKEPRISDSDLKQEVEDRQTEGWEIEKITDSGERVVMTATEGGTIGGHALTGVLTGLGTFGAGNVVYSKLSKKKNKERIVLRADSQGPEESQADLIRELGELRDGGLITEEEFQEKKEKILDDI